LEEAVEGGGEALKFLEVPGRQPVERTPTLAGEHDRHDPLVGGIATPFDQSGVFGTINA
jgi:hypothetical protein